MADNRNPPKLPEPNHVPGETRRLKKKIITLENPKHKRKPYPITAIKPAT